MLLTCRSFSWYSDSRVSVPRLHHGGNNGVWWHVPFKFVMVVVFLVVKKYLAKSKGKIKYQKLETVMYLQWGSRRGRVSNLCCRSPSQELSIQKKVISTVRVKRKKRKEKITLKYTARNAYLWAAHKRPTFQLEINFTSSLFIFPPVIKNIADIWRIRVNRAWPFPRNPRTRKSFLEWLSLVCCAHPYHDQADIKNPKEKKKLHSHNHPDFYLMQGLGSMLFEGSKDASTRESSTDAAFVPGQDQDTWWCWEVT